MPRKRGGQPLDLVGQRFGWLVVLEPAPRVGGLVAWRCRCGCGREAVATTKVLRSGGKTSCGCRRRATLQEFRDRGRQYKWLWLDDGIGNGG